MQRSEFKLLQEIYSSLNEGKLNTLSKIEITKINDMLEEYKLTGHDDSVRFESPLMGIRMLENALEKAGFEVDMIMGALLGDEGRRRIHFSRSTGIDETHQIDADISFKWTKVGKDENGKDKYKIECYINTDPNKI
jgi:hypothetical protein